MVRFGEIRVMFTSYVLSKTYCNYGDLVVYYAVPMTEFLAFCTCGPSLRSKGTCVIKDFYFFKLRFNILWSHPTNKT